MTKKRVKRVGPREGYDAWSEAYDDTPNPVVAMDTRHTLALLAPRPSEEILDAGCGTGRHFEPLLLAGSKPVGIDFSLGMLRVARRKFPQVRLALADLERPLPFKPQCFDAVLCSLVGEHLRDLLCVFQQSYDVLRPDGRFVFSVYHPEMAAAGKEANFKQSGVEFRLGAYRHTVADYVSMIEGAGFVRITLHEFRGDRDLISTVPQAAKYLDFPVLLVVQAKKNILSHRGHRDLRQS